MNKHAPRITNTPASHTSSSSPVIVATPSTISIEPEDEKRMETAHESSGPASALESKKEQPTSTADVGTDGTVADQELSRVKMNPSKKRDKKKHAGSKKQKRAVVESSSEESSSDGESSTSGSSSDDDSSEDEHERRRNKKKAEKKKLKKKAKTKVKAKKRKAKRYESSSDDESSFSDSSRAESSASSMWSSDSESESEPERRRRKKKTRKARKPKRDDQSEVSQTTESTADTTTTLQPPDGETQEQIFEKIAQLMQRLIPANQVPPVATTNKAETAGEEKKEKKRKKGKLGYKRVDQVWDSKIYDYKITESAEKTQDEIDSAFIVRRTFTWDNRYDCTVVDIHSNPLQDALKEVFKDVKGLSLVEETPAIDPNLLFLYYDELEAFYKTTLRGQLKREKKKMKKKQLTQQIAHCKLLASYIDKDYEATRKRLKPMLKAGNITFDLIWALFKPNTIAYTTTYGNKDDPRCFQVEYATKQFHVLQGEWWTIEGRYLEYDGKVFGLGDHAVKIESFKGPRKITSLATYPLPYHKDPDTVSKELVERGKKFVALQGRHYRSQRGLGYQQVKKAVVKHSIDGGRVMVDPALFRRINPNYPLSYVKHDEDEANDDLDDSDADGCCSDSDEDGDYGRTRYVFHKDKKGNWHVVELPAGGDINDLANRKLEAIEAEDGSTHVFTRAELLIASPVVLGFSFSAKCWLEFSLSGIGEIEWNAEAFDSLVLPPHIKQNLRGLVSSHRFHAAKTVDDVIQGKGKGLNVVLHGPPGVGKTLTGESIADFLKCPLYAVSAGELGTNSRTLEGDLNRIMDMCHSWGAILLLDEADVFLEQRQSQDVHRNALVSVFLRLLEYYQGILFLTTNRVETFDEAVQSRIHMGIRYENLTIKARREIWQHHIRKIEAMQGQQCVPFTEGDFEQLSRKVLNGRQIKNTVKIAHSTSLTDEKPFSIEYVKRSLAVNEDFQNDMRGGSGRLEVMYT